MPIADLDGHSIHYRIDGGADWPVLALSNSLGTDLHMWDKVVPSLAHHFCVLRYDTRGHGGSSVTAPPYSIPQLGEDLLGLLDFLELDCVHLCGLSLGGMIAQWLAIHHAERFSRFIFANTAAKIGDYAMWEERIRFIRERGMMPLAERMMHRWFSFGLLQNQPEELTVPRSTMAEVSAEGYIGCCIALRDEDLRAQVGQIASPCLVITSEADIATPPVDGRALHEAIIGSQLVELPGGHLSAWECPEEFQSVVLRYLA